MSKPDITRRDFLNGIALTLGSVASSRDVLASTSPVAASDTYYPPKLTGLRGTHAGAFEVAHSVAWEGKQWPIPEHKTDEIYDLVVVGAGISGLSAAMLFQQKAGFDTRILLIDNHDDFGGHAKRNEFIVDGKELIGYGGSQSIDTPSAYSKVSAQVLKDLAIETSRFNQYFDGDFKNKWSLRYGLFFTKKQYGKNILTDNPFHWDPHTVDDLNSTVKKYPIPDSSKKALINYINGNYSVDLPDWSYQEKIAALRKISYYDFLRQHAKLSHEAIAIFNDSIKSLWGVGWDALSTLEAVRQGLLDSEKLGLKYKDIDTHEGENEPYIYHFPDGNAGIARALVRKLIPNSMPGHSMEDLVANKVDYSQLDQEASSVRLRLNSTAVHVEHSYDKQQVGVTYIQNDNSFKVQAKHCIMACYNNIIPHICPELPAAQKQAIDYATKIPLVYANVALRNWKAFAKAGFSGFHIPKSNLFDHIVLDFPVSMGGYKFSSNPDQPILLHCSMVPAKPYQNLSGRDQHRLGRQKIYQLSFDDYEKDLFNVLHEALSPFGFDAVNDIAGITINRWPHGYAYEYNELFDPPEWSPHNGPHIAGSAQIGRISIANSDASAYAYVNGAIDAADKAVNEQLGKA
tara:strand:- start:359 stop:2245 length:1887 start_codon:yes stop_codon:yes gene_type:complete